MKKYNYMDETDYCVFEFEKNMLSFKELFFQKKWKSIIRSELEKMYPSFDSFTLWQVKGLYSFFRKKILVIVVEPEVYARYKMKSKKMKILYKGKKYTFSLNSIHIFLGIFSFIFLIALLFFYRFYNKERYREPVRNHSFENIFPEETKSKLLSVYTALECLKKESRGIEFEEFKWELDKTGGEVFEITIEDIFPEQISEILNLDKKEHSDFKILSIAYKENTPQVTFLLRTKTSFDVFEKNKIEVLRSYVQSTGGSFLKEKTDQSEINFKIPQKKLKAFNVLCQKEDIAIKKIDLYRKDGQLFVTVQPAETGVSLHRILKYFEDERETVVQTLKVAQVREKKVFDGDFLGKIIDERGNEKQYFKSKDNKIFVLENKQIGGRK
jgi:hypothetical protein